MGFGNVRKQVYILIRELYPTEKVWAYFLILNFTSWFKFRHIIALHMLIVAKCVQSRHIYTSLMCQWSQLNHSLMNGLIWIFILTMWRSDCQFTIRKLKRASSRSKHSDIKRGNLWLSPSRKLLTLATSTIQSWSRMWAPSEYSHFLGQTHTDGIKLSELSTS